MKNSALSFVGMSLLCFMAGCESSGISARDPDGQSTIGLVQAFSMQPTTQTLNANRTMHYPAVLAVAQIGEINPPRAMIEVLQKDPAHFSAVLTMPALTSSNGDGSVVRNGSTNRVYQPDLDTYRNLASRLGADYLLLVGGTADTLEDTGALTAMDLSIVGMFVLPTHMVRGEVKAVAMVIDVHDGTPMAIQTAEMDGKTLVTAVQVESERVKLIEKLRDQAAVKIAKDLCK